MPKLNPTVSVGQVTKTTKFTPQKSPDFLLSFTSKTHKMARKKLKMCEMTWEMSLKVTIS